MSSSAVASAPASAPSSALPPPTWLLGLTVSHAHVHPFPEGSKLAVAIAAAALLIRLLGACLRRALVPRTARARALAHARAAELRAIARRATGADAFATRARAQRGALALEKRVESLDRAVALAEKSPWLKVPRYLWLAFFLALLALAFFRNPESPNGHVIAAILPADLAGTFGKHLMARRGRGIRLGDGALALGPLAWGIFCYRATGRLVNPGGQKP